MASTSLELRGYGPFHFGIDRGPLLRLNSVVYPVSKVLHPACPVLDTGEG